MDFQTLQIVTIAVLSPFLLFGGMFFLLSTAKIKAAAIAVNTLATMTGGLRFGLDLPEGYQTIFSTLFFFFLILALTVNVRIGFQFSTARTRGPGRGRSLPVKSATAPQRVGDGGKDESKLVTILSRNAWQVHNEWGDIRVFKVPGPIMDNHEDWAGSMRQFLITYEEDAEPIEEPFTITKNFEIRLPNNLVNKLQNSELIRFEILD